MILHLNVDLDLDLDLERTVLESMENNAQHRNKKIYK